MRKNIFEIIDEKEIDFYDEIKRINERVTKSYDFLIGRDIEKFVNEFLFFDWKYNENKLELNDFSQDAGVEDVIDNFNVKLFDFLLFSEYILNLIYLILIKGAKTYEALELDYNEQLDKLKEYIINLLSKANFDYNIIDKEEVQVIVIEKNPSATAIAEIIEDIDISRDIIRYNHYTIRGNITEKKKILSQLYKEFEKIRKKLEANNYKGMASDCGLLFNALDIRHATHVDPEVTKRVKDMTDDKLEEWFDKTYDLFLSCELMANYIDMGNDITWLKTGVKK